METPINYLFDKIENLLESNISTEVILRGLINTKETLKEKEKQVIIEAFYNGNSDQTITPEQYFKETFKD